MKTGILGVGVLLLAAGFKGSADGPQVFSADWSALTVPVYVNYIRQLVPFLIIGTFLHWGWTILWRRSIFLPLGFSAKFYAFFIFAVIIRLAFSDFALMVKWCFSLAVLLYIAACVAGGVYEKGWGGAAYELCERLLFSSFVLAVVNSHVLLVDMGYVPGVPRFFGITGHPNFIGVQAAISILLCIPFIMIKKHIFLVLVTLFMSIYLLFESGSRTGVVIAFIGVVVFFCIYYRRLLPVVIGFCVFLLVLFGFGYVEGLSLGDNSLGDVYARGENGSNTRNYVWSVMLGDFIEKPLLGYGYYGGPSESSYLRAMVSFGFMISIMQFVAIYGSIRLLIYRRNIVIPLERIFMSTFGSILAAILIGGVFEGFLLDTFSFVSVILFSALCILSSGEVRYEAK